MGWPPWEILGKTATFWLKRAVGVGVAVGVSPIVSPDLISTLSNTDTTDEGGVKVAVGAPQLTRDENVKGHVGVGVAKTGKVGEGAGVNVLDGGVKIGLGVTVGLEVTVGTATGTWPETNWPLT
jgi:hypothetical protein